MDLHNYFSNSRQLVWGCIINVAILFKFLYRLLFYKFGFSKTVHPKAVSLEKTAETILWETQVFVRATETSTNKFYHKLNIQKQIKIIPK